MLWKGDLLRLIEQIFYKLTAKKRGINMCRAPGEVGYREGLGVYDWPGFQ